MPVAAALPAIIGVAGGVASGVGSMLSANAANSTSMVGPIPAPKPINPQLNSLYQSIVGGKTGLGSTAAGSLQQMASTGLPTDVLSNFAALVSAGERQRSQGQANILEQFGSRGLRFGTTTANALVDYNTQSNKDLLSILSNYIMQTQESAANRQLQASEFTFADFSQSANSLFQEYVPKVGSQSVAGAGLSSMGNWLTMLSLMKSMGNG